VRRVCRAGNSTVGCSSHPIHTTIMAIVPEDAYNRLLRGFAARCRPLVERAATDGASDCREELRPVHCPSSGSASGVSVCRRSRLSPFASVTVAPPSALAIRPSCSARVQPRLLRAARRRAALYGQKKFPNIPHGGSASRFQRLSHGQAQEQGPLQRAHITIDWADRLLMVPGRIAHRLNGPCVPC
jgi:hypothetical protein